MRRAILLAVFSSCVVMSTACGNKAAPTAAPSPSSVVASPTAPAPSPSPTIAALSAAELAACGERGKLSIEVFKYRALYAGYVKGTYKGGDAAKKAVLADLKKAVARYQAHLTSALSQVSNERLQAAVKSDIAVIGKEVAALKAAGTDYDHKVKAAVDAMQLSDGSDNQFGAVCDAG